MRAAGKDGEGKGTRRARGGGWAWDGEPVLEEGPPEAGPSREGNAWFKEDGGDSGSQGWRFGVVVG